MSKISIFLLPALISQMPPYMIFILVSKQSLHILSVWCFFTKFAMLVHIHSGHYNTMNLSLSKKNCPRMKASSLHWCCCRHIYLSQLASAVVHLKFCIMEHHSVDYVQLEFVNDGTNSRYYLKFDAQVRINLHLHLAHLHLP